MLCLGRNFFSIFVLKMSPECRILHVKSQIFPGVIHPDPLKERRNKPTLRGQQWWQGRFAFPTPRSLKNFWVRHGSKRSYKNAAFFVYKLALLATLAPPKKSLILPCVLCYGMLRFAIHYIIGLVYYNNCFQVKCVYLQIVDRKNITYNIKAIGFLNMCNSHDV